MWLPDCPQGRTGLALHAKVQEEYSVAEMKHQDTKEYSKLQISNEAILTHFRERATPGGGQQVHDPVYHLMRLILEHRDFHSLESLIEYCRNHDNLRPWRLHEADRVILSAELVDGLCKMALDSGGGLPSASNVK